MKTSGFIVGDRIISLAFSTHPDWSAGFGRHYGFSFVGASAIGQLHLREGKNREDAFLVRSRGTWLVLLVADGVGSAELGGWGASLAVNFFAEELLRALPARQGSDDVSDNRKKRWRGYGAKLSPSLALQEVGTLAFYRKRDFGEENQTLSAEELPDRVFQALEKTHAFLVATARRENREPRSLATTLLGVLFDAVTLEGLAFQIGDGLILSVSTVTSTPLLDTPDFAVGETAVLTQGNWREWCRWGFLKWGESQAVILMTDGVADDCLYPPPQNVLQRFGQDLVRELTKVPDEETAARRLLFWLSEYTAPSSFDDRTVVALYR